MLVLVLLFVILTFVLLLLFLGGGNKVGVRGEDPALIFCFLLALFNFTFVLICVCGPFLSPLLLITLVTSWSAFRFLSFKLILSGLVGLDLRISTAGFGELNKLTRGLSSSSKSMSNDVDKEN